jgi:hypothetical protein
MISGAAIERDSRRGIVTLYYDNDQGIGFHSDTLAALKAAAEAKDAENVERIWGLWQVYFEDRLPSAGLRQLVDWLEGQRVWRRYEGWPVFKTVGTPCLAFTASLDTNDEEMTLVALGICYKYPAGDEDLWWHDTILPRVRSL